MVEKEQTLFFVWEPPMIYLVGGTTPMGSLGSLFAMVGGCEVVQRAGLEASTGIIYPGSGHEDA